MGRRSGRHPVPPAHLGRVQRRQLLRDASQAALGHLAKQAARHYRRRVAARLPRTAANRAHAGTLEAINHEQRGLEISISLLLHAHLFKAN